MKKTNKWKLEKRSFFMQSRVQAGINNIWDIWRLRLLSWLFILIVDAINSLSFFERIIVIIHRVFFAESWVLEVVLLLLFEFLVFLLKLLYEKGLFLNFELHILELFEFLQEFIVLLFEIPYLLLRVIYVVGVGAEHVFGRNFDGLELIFLIESKFGRILRELSDLGIIFIENTERIVLVFLKLYILLVFLGVGASDFIEFEVQFGDFGGVLRWFIVNLVVFA